MQGAPLGLEAVRECGWPAFVVLLVAAIGSVLALVTLSLAIARLRWALALAGFAACVALSAIALGVVGSAVAERQVDRALAIAGLDASQLARIRAQGYAEAEQCTKIGVASGALPLTLSLIGMLVALLRRPRSAA
jgi:hypothetical protein